MAISATTPEISIVIPVLDESKIIDSLIAHLRELDRFRQCEVIVVDGDPGGSTLNATTDVDVVRLVAKPGRGRQMNAGADVARGRILLFLHADTRLPGDAISSILKTTERGDCDAGAFGLSFDHSGRVYRVMAALVTWRTRRRGEPYGDQAIFVRAGYFRRIGRFLPIPVMEDVEFVRRVRRAGGSIRVLDSRVRTSARRMESEGLVRRVFENAMITVLYLMGVPPVRLAGLYRRPSLPRD